MLNKVVIVGRLKAAYQSESLRTKGYAIIEVTVPDNLNKESYTLITLGVTNKVYDNIKEYCTYNHILGIQGRITNELEFSHIIADNVTFLTNKNTNKEID